MSNSSTRNLSYNSDEITYVNVALPRHIRERARAIGKKLNMTTTRLMADALIEKMDTLEGKWRLEKEEKAQERLLRRSGQKGLRAFVGAPPARAFQTPINQVSTSIPQESTAIASEVTEEIPNEFTKLYDQFARKIASQNLPPQERRLQVLEAAAEIAKLHPLSTPESVEVITELEKAVNGYLKPEIPNVSVPTPASPFISQPPSRLSRMVSRIEDDLMGKELDLNRILTFGEEEDK